MNPSSSPTYLPHPSNTKRAPHTHTNKLAFQLTRPVSVESIVAALRDLPCPALLLNLTTQYESAPPIMASEIRPPGPGHPSGWSTYDDPTRKDGSNWSSHQDNFGNKGDDYYESGGALTTDGWHSRDSRHPASTTAIGSPPFWATGGTRIYGHHNELLHPPPPPPPPTRTVQHFPPNRYPSSFQQALYSAEPHSRFESNRAQFEHQPISPTLSGSIEDTFGGHRSHDGYDNNHYSANTTPESRSDPWFNGDYRGDEEYIPEDLQRSPSESSRSPSHQLEYGPRHNLRTPAFDFLTGPIAHGPDACVIEERGSITFIEQHDEGLILEPRSLEEDGPDDPLLMVHTRRYLDPVIVNNPLIHLRLVMPAGQLPRGDAFARMSGHLRARHSIDTFLIPHESSNTPSHHDVVFGLSGTLDRVCRALRDLLERLVHGTDGFVFWRLSLLIPLDIIHLVAEGRKERSPVEPWVSFSRCSLPRLRNATGRIHDSISNTDECILSIQSCSLDIMLNAVQCLGDVMAQEEDALLLCEEFYTGGWPSVIPAERRLPKELTHSTTNLDRLTPAGYILRPEMKECLQVIRVSREAGALVSFSEEVPTENDSPIRFCDIGSNNTQALEVSVHEIIRWLYEMASGGWSIYIVVPERIAVSWRSREIVAGWTWRGFLHTVKDMSEFCRPTSADTFELEPSEGESVLDIKSKTMGPGIRAAVRAILSAMYSRDG
ncbi:hypothetical protein EC957_006334 [Mortierella hygrophila]|uniref:Uncharacterized protein n=1 Tax=Mortierella hygrophila TaxID=979708 RepID=A0A9P6EY85_9FUNG|nr:hypothetical protein EC957_006334 [Mortierella hygrophila]